MDSKKDLNNIMNAASQTPSGADIGETLVERDGPVTILKLNYPKRRNALSLPLRASLIDALTAALADDTCRVIVLTGEGGHFCSGGDISSFEGITPAAGRSRMRRAHGLIRLITQSDKPVIAAVEGHAAGAGMCIAADCDIVVSAADAKFSCTFNKIGLLPDLGGLWSIPLRVGIGQAKKLMFTGRMIDGNQALALGLADEVCESGKALETAVAMGHEIARVSPISNGMVKAALSQAPLSLEDVLATEANGQGLLYGTEDFQEGKKAFFEKRPPQFKGN